MQVVNTLTLRSNSLQLGSLWGSESPTSTECCASGTRAKLQQYWEADHNLYQLLVAPTHLTGEPGMELRLESCFLFAGGRGWVAVLRTRERDIGLSWRVGRRWHLLGPKRRITLSTCHQCLNQTELCQSCGVWGEELNTNLLFHSESILLWNTFQPFSLFGNQLCKFRRQERPIQNQGVDASG